MGENMTEERRTRRPALPGRRRRASSDRSAPLAGDRKGEQLHEILDGLLASSEPGQRLPSERELAERYGVARMTVRGVLGRLASEGLVYRIQGQGTFVAQPRVAQPSTLTSFSEDMAARGMRPGTIVLAQEVVPASDAVAHRLELAAGEPIVRIERIRSGDGEPIALERTHLPAARFPGLDEVDLVSASLYATLASVYGCELATSEQRIAAVGVGDAEAHLLHIEPATPALRIERVTRDGEGAVIEFVRSLYRGDRFELHTQQLRDPAGARPEHAVGAGMRP